LIDIAGPDIFRINHNFSAVHSTYWPPTIAEHQYETSDLHDPEHQKHKNSSELVRL